MQPKRHVVEKESIVKGECPELRSTQKGKSMQAFFMFMVLEYAL
jgi:hypothetical protein